MLDNPMHPRERKMEQRQEALEQAMNSVRCGAKTRQGNGCQSPSMKNGRCRTHGGKSSGAPLGKDHGKFKHGLYTKLSLKFHEEIKELMKHTQKMVIKN